MMRFALAATLLAGCRLSLENADDSVCTVDTTQPCLDAVTAPATLAWIETNIFAKSCNFSGCHNGANGSNESSLDLSPGASGAHLVNASASTDTSRKLVVPNDVEASYLMLMLQAVLPANASPPAKGLPAAGAMPQSLGPLCCQKLELIERWINAGAPTS